MDFGDYVTEKMAAARLGELRAQCARVALVDSGPRGAGSAWSRAWDRPDPARPLARPRRGARSGMAGVRVARVR